MPKYKVWFPDQEDEEDAMIVTESTPEEAAENYASQVFNAGFSDSFDLMVTDEDGLRYDVTVDVDYEPTFMSHVNKVKKAK